MKLFTKEIDKKLFQQYPYGNDLASQQVVAKIFNPYGRGTWYLLNSDPADPDYLWAIVDLFEVEVGSVSRSELESIKVKPFGLGLERDLYFSPVNALELYRGLQSGKRYANGGISDVEVIEKNNEAYLGMPQIGKGSTMVKLEHGGNLDMLKNQAVQFKHHAEELHNVLKSNPDVHAWVVAKAERASTDLSDITHYLEGNKKMANGGQLAMFEQGGNILSEDTVGRINDPAFADVGMYAKGGKIRQDLFDDYESQPKKLRNITEKWAEKYEDEEMSYSDTSKFLKEVESVGYTFDYGLDNMPYGLRPKGVKLSQLEGFEDAEEEYANGGEIKNGSLVRVKKYGWIMRVDKIDGNMYYLENDRRGTMNGNAGSYLESDIELIMARGGKSKSYMSGDEFREKLEDMSDEELLDYYVEENGFDPDDEDHKERIEEERDDVIDELVEDYVRMMKSSGRFYAKGGGVGSPTNKEVFDNGDIMDSWTSDIGGSNMSQDLVIEYNGQTYLVSTNFEGGVIKPNSKARIYEYAKGGGVDMDNYAYAKTRGIENIDWEKEMKEYYGSDWDKLTKDEKESAIEDAKREAIRSKSFAKGGKTTFKDKVASIKAKLLKNKKVPKAVQKDYGKTFSPAEAEDSAKRIAGAMRKKEMAKK